MPPKGKKATSKSVKRPSDTQSDDDSQPSVHRQPAEQPEVIVISDDESTSSDQTDQQQARESIQKMIKEFRDDNEKRELHLAQTKQFFQDVTASVDTLNEKLVGIFKRQERERKMLHSNYFKSLETLFQQWDKNVVKVRQEEESFIASSHQRAKSFHNTMTAQKAAMDEAKTISDQFLKNIQELEEKHKILDALEQNRLENEMENLKKKLVSENHQQDLAAIKSCFHSMFSKDTEEDKL